MKQFFPKLVSQTLPDQVAGMIMQRIASGELASGQMLPPQRQLAQSMGVSLAVVREAVKRLEALNVLDAAHGSGTIVRAIKWTPFLYDPSLFTMAMQNLDIKHLWETRRLLEGQIVRLAAERAKPHHIDDIRAVLDRADTLPLDYELSSDLNREFHIAVAKAAQNKVLTELLTPLVDVHFHNISHHFTEDVCRRSWEAHEAIFRAIAKRDVKAAERAMLQHFTVGPIAAETNKLEGRSKTASKSTARRRK